MTTWYRHQLAFAMLFFAGCNCNTSQVRENELIFGHARLPVAAATGSDYDSSRERLRIPVGNGFRYYRSANEDGLFIIHSSNAGGSMGHWLVWKYTSDGELLATGDVLAWSNRTVVTVVSLGGGDLPVFAYLRS